MSGENTLLNIKGSDALRMIIGGITAWFVGLGSYALALRVFYGETLSLGSDLTAVLYWSAIGLGGSIAMVILPAFMFLRWLLNGYQPMRYFLYVGVAMGIFPVALIAGCFAGNWREMISEEAILFYGMFTVMGLILSLSFVIKRDESRLQS